MLITNHYTATTKFLIERYARRMTIEQRLAEAIRSFQLDSLSSSVPLNVDLDVVLSVLASAICAALRQRLPGYHTATPDTLQRRFLQTSGVILKTDDTITVQLDRRAYSPVLRAADLHDTTVPCANEGPPMGDLAPCGRNSARNSAPCCRKSGTVPSN